MMKKFLAVLALAVMLPVLGQEVLLDAKAKKKSSSKKGQTEVVEKKDTVKRKKTSKYEKMFIKDKTVVTAKCEDGFLTLHKAKGKLYIELPMKYMGREMLIASTITESSAADLASIGYKPVPPIHVRFSKVDSTIFMKEVTVLPDYDVNNKAMAKAVELINGKCESEASGGITREMLHKVAATGVDYISAGALTHSASNIDLSLKAVQE